MWRYEKRLQYPIHIKTPNAKIAQIIMSQYGGPYRSNLCKKRDYKNSLFFYEIVQKTLENCKKFKEDLL